jgi:protein-tyrosine phosphatase
MTIIDTSPESIPSCPSKTTSVQTTAALTFERILNARDINEIAPDHISPRVVIRSALPSLASASDLRQLTSLGVRQVIDLRSLEECALLPGVTSLPSCQFFNVPLVVAPWNFAALDSGQSVESFLADEYLSMMNNSGDRIRQVLELIAEFDGTTLLHCTAGKDRTGIIVALLGVIAAAPISNIVSDYEKSAEAMPSLFGLLQSAVPAGMDAANPTMGDTRLESQKRRELLFMSPRLALDGVLSRVFPFPHKYFDEIGFSRATRRHLQTKLLLRSEKLADIQTEYLLEKS